MTFRGPVIPILPMGGLNDGGSGVNIPDNQSPDCLNVRFGRDQVEKRDGITRYITTEVSSGKAVTGIAQLVLSNGTSYQVAAAGSALTVESGGAWSSIKGALTFTDSQNNHFRFAQLTDLLVGTNNVDQVFKYSGSGNAAALGGVPASFLAKAITDYKNYLVFLNTSEAGTRYKGRCRWSGLNNAESYPAANYNDSLNNVGQEGMGFGKRGDQLYLFFDRSIQEMVYTGDADTPFLFPTVEPEIGAASGHAIVTVDNNIVFPSQKGIYVMQGGEPQYISKDIEDTWESLNASRLPYIQGAHNKRRNEVWFSVSTGANTTNNKVLVYNYVTNQWTVFDSWNANAFGVFPSSKPLDPILGNYSGFVYRTNTGTYLDDTSAITAYLKTKYLSMGDPGRKCQVRRLQIFVSADSTEGAVLEVSNGYTFNPVSDPRSIDFTVGGSEFDSAIFDLDTFAVEGIREVFYRPRGHGRMVQFEFRNEQASAGMVLHAVNAWVSGERGSGGGVSSG